MSAHIHHEEKNNEDRKTHMSHERGDHKDHKHEDWDYPDHKEEDHIARELGFIIHRIHQHEDHLSHNPRLGFHTGFHHY